MLTLSKSYFAAGIIARRRKNKIEYLVMKTEKLYGPDAGLLLTKFPGGMEEPPDNRNPEKTLREEIEEETGFRIKDGANVRVLLQQEVMDNHHKFFFLTWRSQCRGRLRTETIDDGHTRLYRPEWVDLDTLHTIICDSHRPVLEKLDGLT